MTKKITQIHTKNCVNLCVWEREGAIFIFWKNFFYKIIFINMDIYTFLEEESEIDNVEEEKVIVDKKKGNCIIMWMNN